MIFLKNNCSSHESAGSLDHISSTFYFCSTAESHLPRNDLLYETSAVSALKLKKILATLILLASVVVPRNDLLYETSAVSALKLKKILATTDFTGKCGCSLVGIRNFLIIQIFL